VLSGGQLAVGERGAGSERAHVAAHRAGLTTILIPKRNEPDLEDVPESVLSELTVHPVSDVREVLELVLELALEPAQVNAHQYAA
jgi:ATP-dependent Lon protease